MRFYELSFYNILFTMNALVIPVGLLKRFIISQEYFHRRGCNHLLLNALLI